MTHVLLWGPPGAGKSVVGPLVAARLGRGFVDLDRAIEAAHGVSVATTFRELGEEGFRRIEVAMIDDVLSGSSPLVVSLGGGSLVATSLRRRVLREHRVIELRASAETLERRLSGSEMRPLLSGPDPKAALASLLDARAEAYCEAHATVDTDELSVEAVADRVVHATLARKVVVPLGHRTYVATIGRGASNELVFGGEEQLSIFDERWSRANATHAVVERASYGACVALDVREKSIASVERVWREAAAYDLGVDSSFVAFGGGGTLDVAGFAAATWKRGVAWTGVPTTALAMVDSALGGKTGIDFADRKNSVGAVHQPREVIVDPAWLDSLGPEQRRDGLVEALKCAMLEGHASMAAFEVQVARIEGGDLNAWDEIIARSLTCKAGYVADDEFDRGSRRALNFGHTVGHALELTCGLSHGEAVAWGLLAELRLASSARRGRLRELHAWTHAMLLRLGFSGAPTIGEPVLRRNLAADKKRSGSHIEVHRPNGDGAVEVLEASVGDIVCAFFAPP